MKAAYLLVTLSLFMVKGIPAEAEEGPFFEKRVILERGMRQGAFAIPKLVITPGGTALVVAQDREGGDWGRTIRPIVLRSADGGRSWSEPTLLIPEDFPDRERYHMKPTGMVVDSRTSRVFVFVSRSPLKNGDGKTIQEKWFYSHIQETRELGRAWFLVTSDDEGESWSKPAEITKQLIKKPHWQEWSPVHTGIQLRFGAHRGRLVVPVRCYCPEMDPSPHDWQYQTNAVLYSDDGGLTWIPGARTDAYLGECVIAERADGTLYMNQRASPGGGRASERWYTISPDGGTSFDPTRPTGLPDVRCHTGITTRTDAEGHSLMLLTSIPGKERRELTISVSKDQGETWTQARVIEPGHAAYSDLDMLPDGNFLCVYETGETTSRKDLAVARFNLDWVLEEISP